MNVGLWFRARFWAQVLLYRILVAPFHRYRWRPYDPSWLLSLAKEQLPEEGWLHDEVSACVRASGNIPYIHFVSASRSNRLGSEWQFDKNIHLDHPEYGELILDILKDKRVGGIEFLGLMLEHGHVPNIDVSCAQQDAPPGAPSPAAPWRR
jgi:hypothetical protein